VRPTGGRNVAERVKEEDRSRLDEQTSELIPALDSTAAARLLERLDVPDALVTSPVAGRILCTLAVGVEEDVTELSSRSLYVCRGVLLCRRIRFEVQGVGDGCHTVFDIDRAAFTCSVILEPDGAEGEIDCTLRVNRATLGKIILVTVIHKPAEFDDCANV
jgi:hypothetical protein